MTNVYEQLHPHLNTRQRIQIRCRRVGEDFLNGYLMGLSRDLGVMHCFDDFEPDGYSVFPLSDVVYLRSSEHERHWDRMLTEEGLLDGLDQTPHLELEDYRTAIQSISDQYQLMSVLCEGDDPDFNRYYIGQPASLDHSEMQFDHFNGLGQWEATPVIVPLSEIVLIEFDTPYIRIFSKYLSGSPSATRIDTYE